MQAEPDKIEHHETREKRNTLKLSQHSALQCENIYTFL
jgi:hypothetical protein